MTVQIRECLFLLYTTLIKMLLSSQQRVSLFCILCIKTGNTQNSAQNDTKYDALTGSANPYVD